MFFGELKKIFFSNLKKLAENKIPKFFLSH